MFKTQKHFQLNISFESSFHNAGNESHLKHTHQSMHQGRRKDAKQHSSPKQKVQQNLKKKDATTVISSMYHTTHRGHSGDAKQHIIANKKCINKV